METKIIELIYYVDSFKWLASMLIKKNNEVMIVEISNDDAKTILKNVGRDNYEIVTKTERKDGVEQAWKMYYTFKD
jgi:cytochrome oxidase Cu insertion factor (SCO1/SenC/PrrC family)